jgi:hypothetical protein
VVPLLSILNATMMSSAMEPLAGRPAHVKSAPGSFLRMVSLVLATKIKSENSPKPGECRPCCIHRLEVEVIFQRYQASHSSMGSAS